MDITLVNPPEKLRVWAGIPKAHAHGVYCFPPLGLMYIQAAVEKRSSYKAEICDPVVDDLDYPEFEEMLKRYPLDLVGISTYTHSLPDVQMTINIVRKLSPNARIVLGGPHCAMFPDYAIQLEGAVKVAGTDRQMAWHEVGLAAYTAHNLPAGMEPGLKEGAFYDPVNFTFPAGAYIAEVEVDPATGVTEVVRFTAADDFGTIINPMIVEGQVHGGVAQGIGQALLEEVVYSDDGQLVTGSFMDYAMPRADDVPFYTIEHNTTVCPNNPLGLKGCGEAGAIGAPPAVINAITDAIGTNDLAMPATPQRVWRAIQAARPAMAAE